MYPPRLTGAQLVPLWKIAGPHTGKLKTGPLKGPGYLLGVGDKAGGQRNRGATLG
jgi:hypothetical protein